MASTSEGPHSLTLTINTHNDGVQQEGNTTRSETKLSTSEVTFNNGTDEIRPTYRSRGKRFRIGIFFRTVCGDGSKSVMLLLFGISCALLSGCCLSSTIVFTGRIKHVLLTHGARTELFRIHAYEQIYVLASLSVFAIVANFCLHMSSNLLGSKIVLRLKEKYANSAKKMSTNRHLQDDINSEIDEKIEEVRKGSEHFEYLCRSGAILIASSFISFYHELRLTLVLLVVIPICIGVHFLSEKLSRRLNDIKRGKAARAAHMERELLLLKNIDGRCFSDERLVRLSDELHSATRYGILKETWDGCYSGILCFILFTAVGCGMLYGGYLLELSIMVQQGDIFIVVLSIALLANTTSNITSQWRALMDGISAAIYIKNLEKIEVDKSRSLSIQNMINSSEFTATNLIPTTKVPAPVKLAPECTDEKQNVKMSFFASGTNKVLKNNFHDRLYLVLGFILAALHGLELPAYNVIMGRVFLAMLEPRMNMMHKLLHTMIMFTCVGFIILIIRTVSGLFWGIASEHISVGFRVNLARHHTSRGTVYTKADVEELVKHHTAKATNAKSFYHPHTSRVISEATSVLTNVILGFAFSWEVALLGTLFTVFCLFIQLEVDRWRSHDTKSVDKKSKDVKRNGDQSELTDSTLLAINFSVLQTSGFVIQTVCYALTAYIVNNGYKYPNEAFMSVITVYGALQHALTLPSLLKLLNSSCSSAHQILTVMYQAPSSSKYTEIPYETALEGFQPPQRIRIVGAPTVDDGTFQINLMRDDEYIFHFNPRLKDQAVIVNNTRDGDWQEEERYSDSFPFKCGETFTLDLEPCGTTIAAFVNGNPLASFPERDDLSTINKLTIDGDINVHSTHIAQ